MFIFFHVSLTTVTAGQPLGILCPLFLKQFSTLKLQRVSSVPWPLGRSLLPCPVLLYATGHGPLQLPFLGSTAKWFAKWGGWEIGDGKLISSSASGSNISSSYAASSVLIPTAPLTTVPQCSQIWPGSPIPRLQLPPPPPLFLQLRDGTTSLYGFSNLPQHLLRRLTVLPTPLQSVPSLKIEMGALFS